MEKYDIETPAPLVDRVKMERNIRRMVEVAQGAGLRLRLHTKTHKCPAIAKIQLYLGAAELTAEIAREHGLEVDMEGFEDEMQSQRERARAAWALDAILVPLVGFDDRGHRLGMGGGVYDRALADLARRPRRPRLIGVAFEFQRQPRLREAAWDQPLDQVVTDVRRYLLS